MRPTVLACACVSALAQCVWAQNSAVSESDYFAEMPLVLSVSRLEQRLDETPGAVTIIDRDMIRLSGARDVAELLRWVPGFQVSASFEADAPTVYYHGAFNEYTSRVQVLMDGRATYSTYLTGSVGLGLMSVALEDIDRIEVLRGSNSAAYGARAFLGVINIITRLPAESSGWMLSAKAGENGVGDRLARLGWGSNEANYRLTLDERGDDGLANSNGHNRVRRANFRGDFKLSGTDEVQVRAGQVDVLAGLGEPNRPGKPFHDHALGQNYAQIDWRRNLGDDADLLVSFSHTGESTEDAFQYPLKQQFPAQFAYLKLLYPQLSDTFPISYTGTASNDHLTVQHTVRLSDKVRAVWGAELRREKITSEPLYNTDVPQVTDMGRLFGNLEWRVRPDVVLNAGGLAEHSTLTGDTFSPRLMANWHAAEGQTWRIGGTSAHRPPSMFEKNANQRFQTDGVVLQLGTIASGNVVPESVLSKELGYLLELPSANLNLDLRLFQEDVSGFVTRQQDQSYAIPAYVVLRSKPRYAPYDVTNGADVHIRGAEYQFKWRPAADTQIVLNQAYTQIDSIESKRSNAAPRVATSLMWFQKMPGDVNLSVMHHRSSPLSPAAESNSSALAPYTRTDLRLAKALRMGSNSGELALVLQNMGKPYADYTQVTKFDRRAFVTLRLEN